MHFIERHLYIHSYISLIPNICQADAIKCWVCHSDTDPKCADPFDNTTLPIKDCREYKPKSYLIERKSGSYYSLLLIAHLNVAESAYEILSRKETGQNYVPKLMTARMCRKIRQKIHGNWRTIRDCAFLGSPGEGTGNEHHCLYRKGECSVAK